MTLSNINLISIIWILIALLLLPIQLKITAPYGRHTNKNWGFLIPNKLGWFLMEIPSLLIMIFFCYKTYYENNNNVSIFLMSCWILHYFNRAIIFPLRTKTADKKMPVSIVFSAIFFNYVNAFLNGYFFLNLANYSTQHFSSPVFLTGLFLFLVGK